MDPVVQKSVKSMGEAYLTCNMALASGVSSAFPPKTTHPSGDLIACYQVIYFLRFAGMHVRLANANEEINVSLSASETGIL